MTCGHCHDTFLFNTLTNALARCPHCRKVSSVGSQFARTRSNIYLAFGLVFLAVAITIILTTYSYAEVSKFVTFAILTTSTKSIILFLFLPSVQNNAGMYFVYVLLILVFTLLFVRTFYYRRMKVSVIEGPI